jgi:hypothetical protein
MYPPLEHVVVSEANGNWRPWRCRIPFCWGAEQGGHGLCEFHAHRANYQIGEPFRQDEDTTFEERSAAYSVHRERELARIPYHLLMASLWPGIGAEERAKQKKREKSLKQKWEEENDYG